MKKNYSIKLSITAHMIVQNEEQWIWYALNAVLPFVAKIIVFDTGSIDKTAKIIQEIKNEKIVFEKKGEVNAAGITKLRNEQIERTTTDWFMLLDGDDVWIEKGLKEVVKTLEDAPKYITALVSHCIVPIGDLFHFQDEKYGHYRISGKEGHFNIRLYRKRSDNIWSGNFPLEAYVNHENIAVQNRPRELLWLKEPYWHMTHLPRSSQDTHQKRKLEQGRQLKQKLPDIFFTTRPANVPTPWVHFKSADRLIAAVFTPLLHLKRRLL